MAKNKKSITVETLTHGEASRTNIPTAELQSFVADDEKSPIEIAYARRNRDLDPQLVWRGKDEQDWSDLVVQAPPIYIQEKVHPKVLIDDLMRRTREHREENAGDMPDLFADFNGLPDAEAATEFYQHQANWTNRMILGDSLQVMASLAEREGLRGKVQCIYIDPPYGIKFNSNFQWSTTTTTVTDGKADHITREPEQVKAFRDTWRDGIHSYLTYLRDRMTVARDLLTDSGSVFVQIGDENVHRVRALMDEVFGEDNFVSQISYKTTQSAGSGVLDTTVDYLVWYARSADLIKFRNPIRALERGEKGATRYHYAQFPDGSTLNAKHVNENDSSVRFFTDQGLNSRGGGSPNTMRPIEFEGNEYKITAGHWRTSADLIEKRLIPAGRILKAGKTLRFKKFFDDFGCLSLTNMWDDVGGGIQSRNDPKVYVVQTSTSIVQRCVLMTTDPGDLVLDPTCGSGTTATVAEQWGRRWITVDTSRVALALARARIMGARYPYYILADSPEGQQKEAEVTRNAPADTQTHGDIRHGFVYERVPHITLKSIAYNAEIETIWETFQEELEPLRETLNAELGTAWEEWEIPREAEGDWSAKAKELHRQWWEKRIERQREIDASIAAKADHEYLYDKPYVDNSRVRVAGPFTVESLSPHRVLAVDENDELIDELAAAEGAHESPGNGSGREADATDFATMVLDHLKTSGVQQAHKEDKIAFTSISGWPGRFVCAEGSYHEGDDERERRAGIFIGPEYGTVSRPDLVAAAREAADAGFDVLIACAFNYDAHSSEFERLGPLPVLKARMNADLHMAEDLKNTGTGNLFVIFGEPDIDIQEAGDGMIRVKVNGVDVFHPQSGEITSSGPEGIACWFIDTDYNEESFFVRHAYFLGASDPYKALKTTLKAEIDEDAWQSLYGDTSRPFEKPASGRIAVKVINHLGDEVMKVFGV